MPVVSRQNEILRTPAPAGFVCIAAHSIRLLVGELIWGLINRQDAKDAKTEEEIGGGT
jgi:hypothetical protein